MSSSSFKSLHDAMPRSSCFLALSLVLKIRFADSAVRSGPLRDSDLDRAATRCCPTTH